MTHFLSLVLFSIIVTLGGVHGRALVQGPRLSSLRQTGQEYYCVEFYKQPAFDHPLLRHLVPKDQGRLNKTTSDSEVKFNIVDGGCPNGTVPILTSYGDPPPTHSITPPEHSTAGVATNTYSKFYGSHAHLSLYKPQAQGNQWSCARIKLSNGGDSIEVGWMVYPQYFKDNEAHFYTRFTAGSKTCMNLDCPGFVQVAKDIPLGSIPNAYSSIDGAQHMWEFSIDKNKDGNWWLSMTLDSTKQVGYWPGNIFGALRDAAAKVEWGGEIGDPGMVKPAPSMGSGLKADYDMASSAFFQGITVVDEKFNHVSPQGTDKYSDFTQFYTVLDWGNHGKDYAQLGRIITYGGSDRDE